jgi:hypothetical protein
MFSFVEWVVLGIAVTTALGWITGYSVYRVGKRKREAMRETLLGVVMPHPRGADEAR